MRNEHEIKMRLAPAEKYTAKYGTQLYHYTSFSSLYGIICKKELWFGNAAMMNDKSEMTNFVDNMKTAALADFPEKTEEVLAFFNELTKNITCKYPYTMCLSKLQDNAAQWERYADNGNGVCIVFNTHTLYQLFFYVHGLFNEVFYEYNIRNHQHYEKLYKYLSCPDYKGYDSKTSWFDNILKTATVYKHGSFISEAECRIVIFPEDHLLEKRSKIFSIEYKSVRDQIKKVMIIKLAELCSYEGINIENLFDSIIIGPKSTQSIDILKDFLRDNGFPQLADKVFYSNCPLR